MQSQMLEDSGESYMSHSASRAWRPTLKCGDLFAVFGPTGEMTAASGSEEGLYLDGTRFLSRRHILLDGGPVSNLGVQVREDGEELQIVSGNCQGAVDGIQEHSLTLTEKIFLASGSLYSELVITNFGPMAMSARLSIHHAADYADIYEIRGLPREQRGTYGLAKIESCRVTLAYTGLDNERRVTRINLSPTPDRLTRSYAEYLLNLDAGARYRITTVISCQRSKRPAIEIAEFQSARESMEKAVLESKTSCCLVQSSNPVFDSWWNRSILDLHFLSTIAANERFPYAGIPWFNTPFGRDGLITALETLWIDPELTRGVLRYLAMTQAQVYRAEADAEPGKILHETRSGEMAALREVPFGRYYGSVDAPALFVILAGAYLKRTQDLEFIESVWSAIEMALEWIATDGDKDGDGFVEYQRLTETGLLHQSWKDSDEAIFHEDGAAVKGPFAVCEVQGYVYAALRTGVQLGVVLGDAEHVTRWTALADRVHRNFNEHFWSEAGEFYGLALDGGKKLCHVKASNMGQLLFSGIVPGYRVDRIAEALMSPDLFSGWGIRTLSKKSRCFNPISYHNGSIWPHDNALIAYGLAQFDRKQEANRIFAGMFDAAAGTGLYRLPELFCGFDREKGYGPVPYPVACSPQAWAAGAVSLLLQSSLGLEINAATREVTLFKPSLPSFVEEISVQKLPVRETYVDLLVRRHGQSTDVQAKGASRDISVTVRR
jgi:glycogen debranching enzyme